MLKNNGPKVGITLLGVMLVSLLLTACSDLPFSNTEDTSMNKQDIPAATAGTGGTATLVKPAHPNLPAPPKLDSKRPAPDFDNQTWINSEPLKLADLEGKVVLVEFWTFGCYNCQNVQPALKDLYQSYGNQGFEIVAFHAPEFDYEKQLGNVQKAVQERGIKYPVAIDNDFKTWNKYRVNAWPTLFLLDKQGQIRHQYIGEGQYDVTEAAVVALLNEKN